MEPTWNPNFEVHHVMNFNLCDIKSDVAFRKGHIKKLALFGKYSSISTPFSFLIIFGVRWIFTPESAIYLLVGLCGVVMMTTIDF